MPLNRMLPITRGTAEMLLQPSQMAPEQAWCWGVCQAVDETGAAPMECSLAHWAPYEPGAPYSALSCSSYQQSSPRKGQTSVLRTLRKRLL